MTVLYLATRTTFHGIGDCDGADVSVPLIAHTLKEAIDGIKASYAFDDIPVVGIDVVDYAGAKKLLLVHTGDGGEPVVLLFDPPVYAESSDDMDAAGRAC